MILKGESAEEFNRKADENYEKFKARQKQNLIDMMVADEKLGLYEKPQQEKGEFQRGVDSVKQELHEQRDWCECGNCEPIFKGGKMCKNSKWPIYYPYKPQPTEDVENCPDCKGLPDRCSTHSTSYAEQPTEDARRLKSIEVKIDTLMYDLMTIIERTESKDCAEPTDQQTTEKIYTIEDIERCVENWGLCKVEREYIEKFLATKQVVKDSLTTQTVEERALELYPDTQSSDYLWTMRLQQRQAYIKGATDQNKEDETIPS